MKNLGLILAYLLLTVLYANASDGGRIVGTITHPITNDAVEGLTVAININGIDQSELTDQTGSYTFVDVPSGKYTIVVLYMGQRLAEIKNISVSAGATSIVDCKVANELILDDDIKIVYHENLFSPALNPKIVSLKSNEIKHMPTRNLGDIISTAGGYQRDSESAVVFRGSREGAMLVYVDGIKMRDMPSLPSSGLKQVNIFAGGIPAKYGDCTGGVVEITTKTYFDYWRESQK
jgi:hypothetical protein